MLRFWGEIVVAAFELLIILFIGLLLFGFAASIIGIFIPNWQTALKVGGFVLAFIILAKLVPCVLASTIIALPISFVIVWPLLEALEVIDDTAHVKLVIHLVVTFIVWVFAREGLIEDIKTAPQRQKLAEEAYNRQFAQTIQQELGYQQQYYQPILQPAAMQPQKDGENKEKERRRIGFI